MTNGGERARASGTSQATSVRPSGHMRRVRSNITGRVATPKAAPISFALVQVGIPKA